MSRQPFHLPRNHRAAQASAKGRSKVRAIAKARPAPSLLLADLLLLGLALGLLRALF